MAPPPFPRHPTFELTAKVTCTRETHSSQGILATNSGGMHMLMRTVIMLIHPILATVFVLWLVRQYGWRKKGMSLRGDDRKQALARHQRHGEWLLWSGICLALVAFIARAISGMIVDSDWTSDILPQNVHGFTGPIGLILLWLVVRHGRRTAELKEQNESFTVERTKHGRASDLMMALVMIHSFLGLIYTFQVI